MKTKYLNAGVLEKCKMNFLSHKYYIKLIYNFVQVWFSIQGSCCFINCINKFIFYTPSLKQHIPPVGLVVYDNKFCCDSVLNPPPLFNGLLKNCPDLLTTKVNHLDSCYFEYFGYLHISCVAISMCQLLLTNQVTVAVLQ